MELEATTEELGKKKHKKNHTHKTHNSTRNKYLSCVCHYGTYSCSNYVAFYSLHRYKLDSNFSRVMQGKNSKRFALMWELWEVLLLGMLLRWVTTSSPFWLHNYGFCKTQFKHLLLLEALPDILPVSFSQSLMYTFFFFIVFIILQ